MHMHGNVRYSEVCINEVELYSTFDYFLVCIL